jgi:hypothetical protein
VSRFLNCNAECRYAECLYAECLGAATTPSITVLSIAPLSVDCNSCYFRDAECQMQAFVMLSVITTSAVLWDHIFISKFIKYEDPKSVHIFFYSLIGQNVLDTYAVKQVSKAAIDV